MSVTASAFDRDVERLATPVDNPATFLVDPKYAAEVRALLALTDTVERHRAGDYRIVPSSEDYVGGHKEYVLRPFAFPTESRFSDGTFGVLYAGLSVEVAIGEVAFWTNRYLSDGAFPPGTVVEKQHLSLRACADLADVRLKIAGLAGLYDANDYTVSQQYGAALRTNHDGLWYDSVRCKGGECVGVFVPRIISNVRLKHRYEYVWDGSRVAEVKEVRPL